MRLTAALIVAGLLALANFANLVGAGYAGFAERQLDHPQSPGTLVAARIAAGWLPWSSRRAALHGWLLAENRDADAARAAYGRALRLAPGDPLLWSEYSLALARLGQFDAALTLAMGQARALAPDSRVVRGTIADLGISYWTRGAEEQRALWLAAMRGELQHSRGAFLGRVLTRGQGRTFCGDAAGRLGEDAWCEWIAPALESGCYELKPSGPAPCNPSR